MDIPITQSESWQKLQDDLGQTCFFEQGSGYQYLAILKTTPVGHYLYLPYGPVYANKTGRESALKSLKLLAERHQAIFIRVEPTDPEFIDHLPKNAVKSTDLNPKETWVLDLTGKEDELKAKLPSRLLRYHRNAAKNGLTITTSHDPGDIHYLVDLQQSLAKAKGISTYSTDYLATELSQPFATLYLVHYANPETHQTEVVAAGLIFDDKTTRYNLQGAQNNLGRQFHATGILTIQLILDAKAKRQQLFDFWGIAPEGAPANHPWAGFTNFKKTFTGREVQHAGTYDLVLQPAKYKLYQLLRRVRRLV